MSKNNDVIENLNEQIKKLEKRIEQAAAYEKKENTIEDTKDFDGEDTDTKIFDGEKSVTELLDLKEETNEKNVEIKKDIVEDKAESEGEIDNKTVPTNTVNKKGRKCGRKITIIVLIGLIIVLCVICGIVVYNRINDDKRPVIIDEKELTAEERSEAVKSYGEAIEGIIGVYFSQQSILLNYEDAVKLVEFDKTVKCSVHEVYKDGKLYLNKCSVNGIKTDASYGEKREEVVSDGEVLNVYVHRETAVATLTEPKNISKYNKYSISCDGTYHYPELLSNYSDYVFYFDADDKIQMKNYKTGERAFSNLQYDRLLMIKNVDGSYDTNYIAALVNGFWGIYSLKDNSQIISPMYSWFASATNFGVGIYSYVDAVDDELLIASDGKNFGLINYLTNKTIIPFDYNQLYKSGEYLWAKDENGIGYIFDNAGNRYLADNYDQIYGMVNGIYILVRQDEDIKLVQIDGKLLYNYGKIDNIGGVSYSLSYNNGALFQMYSSNNLDECIEILYDPSTKEGTYKKAICGGMAKPILYLYPEEKTDIIVSFEQDEILETTYPKFTGKWQVTADSKGNLVDKAGKKYYALYWDEKRVHEVSFAEGFYVEKDDAIDFLEDKLEYIGLNDYEMNEFIMYWLPILEKNGKSLVYFEFTEERNSYNKLYISPQPDSLLRLSIHVKEVDRKVNIKKQSLTKFQRKGFVAVEWGGMVY